ncbi:MAG: Flp1 family type IVb pilin [Eubacteriales bacterium]|nr:Flp1 family type IVb pilin [Eubacteriales bacterium]
MSKYFVEKNKGLGTVEIVIIIAVLVGIALIFRDAIVEFAKKLMDAVFSGNEVIDSIENIH